MPPFFQIEISRQDGSPDPAPRPAAGSSRLVRWLPLAVFCLVHLTTSLTAAQDQPAASGKKPNVLFLLADDLRPDGLAALGNPDIKSPNLDQLVNRGFIFKNAYIFGAHIGSVCLPSRTMLYTGCHLFRKNGYGDGTTTTFPVAMKDAGYATIRSGKFGANPNDLCKPFDVNVNGYNSETNANNIIAFIREHAGKAPMFLHMASNEPHDPQFATPEYYPLYQAEKLAMPANFLPLHPFDNGEMTIRDEATVAWPRTRENITAKLARYYASISYWDAHVGRIIQALKDAGQYDNTIIIIAGDNGLSLGEQGLTGKQNVYHNGGMHVPLVFLGPGIPAGKTDALVYLMDVFPTVCDLLGTGIPKGLDAKSLAPVILGKTSKVRDTAFTCYTDVQRSLRDGRWQFIRYPKINRSQLFDLQNDPHELKDLANDPAHAGKVAEFMTQLAKEQKEYGDTCLLTSANPADAKWSPPPPAPAETK